MPRVMCHISHVPFFLSLLLDKLVELVCGGSVINQRGLPRLVIAIITFTFSTDTKPPSLQYKSEGKDG